MGSPPSNVYDLFGKGGISLFFMITSFLFIGHLLDAYDKESGIDWLRLYVSRILRIGPLYIFAVLLAFLIAGCINNWILNESIGQLIEQLADSLALGILDTPVLGALNHEKLMAKVVWTLQYEWAFYGMLPLFALLLGIKVPRPLYILSFFALLFIYFHFPIFATFVGGIIAARLARTRIASYIAKSRMAALTFFALLGVICCSKLMMVFSPVILSVCFIIIACGNSLFGLLEWKYSLLLGELSYSIYLLHGILLFFLYQVIIGNTLLQELSPMEYWYATILSVPLLIVLCRYTFLFIEKRAMRSVNALTAKIRVRN